MQEKRVVLDRDCSIGVDVFDSDYYEMNFINGNKCYLFKIPTDTYDKFISIEIAKMFSEDMIEQMPREMADEYYNMLVSICDMLCNVGMRKK